MNGFGPIFILDDEPICRSATQVLLETYGFECYAFANSGELFDALSENATGLILADYHLVEQNGLEFLKRLREGGHELPIVLISGDAEPGIRRVALNSGIADFLPKPIAADDFRDALIRVLEEH